MATSVLGVRLSEEERRELDANAKALGLTAQSAVKMMISQFNYDHGFSRPMTRKLSRAEIDRAIRDKYSHARVEKLTTDQEIQDFLDED